MNPSSIIRNDYSLLEPELKQSAPGRKILHIVAAENKISRLKQCLARGAEVNIIDGHAKTPLHYAALNNVGDSHFEVAELLLKNRANVNDQDIFGSSPFDILLKTGNARMIELFLNFKADVDKAWFLFEDVQRNKNLHVLQLLINHGFDINQRNYSEKTLLHRIAKNLDESDFKMVEMLLKNGADVNARDFLGQTPLHILVKYGSMKAIKFFLNFNPDVNVLNKNGETLLFSAVFNVDVDVLQFLIDLDINVNHCNYSGLSALHMVCATNKKSILKCLLKNGADINATNRFGHTPLFKAVISCSSILLFFMKHTDFSVAHNNNNVLNLYHTSSKNYVWKMILRHLVILESLNVPVDSAYLTAISKEIKYKDYYYECQKELLRIKTSKFENSWITFYNLLVDDRKKMKNYAGNKDLIEDFKKRDWEEKFPMFGTLFEKNVEKGIKRRELFDKSTVMLSKFWPIFNPTHLVIRDVLDCVLGKNDLLKFCESLE